MTRPDPAPAPAGVAGGAPGQWLCAASDLAERGRAVVWDVLQRGEPARAFALRFGGVVVAYLNRCVHLSAELDWQPGEFLDADRRWILCSMHGAAYEPADGRCVGGPCARGALLPIAVEERDAQVYWYPSRDTRPVPLAERDSPSPGTAAFRTP